MTFLFKLYLITSGAVIIEHINRVYFKKLTIEDFLSRLYESIGINRVGVGQTKKEENKTAAQEWFDEGEEGKEETETKKRYIIKGETVEWLN